MENVGIGSKENLTRTTSEYLLKLSIYFFKLLSVLLKKEK